MNAVPARKALPITARQLRAVGLPAVMAVVTVIATVLADGWRTATLTLMAAAVLAATRIRFAAPAALGLLALVATVAITGGAISRDERPELSRTRDVQAERNAVRRLRHSTAYERRRQRQAAAPGG